MGWKRAAKYIALRIVRLSVASDAVPKGIACGMAASFFPVFGIHALMAIAAAFVIRANTVAAALGTLLFPPVVLPVIFSFDFFVGKTLLEWSGLYIAPAHAAGTTALQSIENFLIPAITGSVLLMMIAWPLSYFLTHKAIGLLRRRYKHGRSS